MISASILPMFPSILITILVLDDLNHLFDLFLSPLGSILALFIGQAHGLVLDERQRFVLKDLSYLLEVWIFLDTMRNTISSIIIFYR